MSHKIPKNGPIAWYMERYGWGIGLGGPGVDDEWMEMLLRPKVEVVQNPSITSIERFNNPEINIISLLFLVFFILFVLLPFKCN